MLDRFYRQLFRPTEAPPSQDIAGLIAVLLLVVMTFNAAASLQASAGGLSFILILFGIGGFLGLFWFAAAVCALSSLLGGSCQIQALCPAIVVGLWPLLLSGAAIAAQQHMPRLGALFSVAIIIGTVVTLARSIAVAQSISALRSTLLIGAAIALSLLAIGGIIVWPLMLLLGL